MAAYWSNLLMVTSVVVYLLALAAFALEWAAARRLEPVGAPAAVLVGTEGAPIEGAEAVSIAAPSLPTSTAAGAAIGSRRRADAHSAAKAARASR